MIFSGTNEYFVTIQLCKSIFSFYRPKLLTEWIEKSDECVGLLLLIQINIKMWHFVDKTRKLLENHYNFTFYPLHMYYQNVCHICYRNREIGLYAYALKCSHSDPKWIFIDRYILFSLSPFRSLPLKDSISLPLELSQSIVSFYRFGWHAIFFASLQI